MFKNSRRRGAAIQPLTKETANPSATTAAASAFMRRDQSQSLSSAAAAAALRARPTTPTNVAEVPTKRAQRRAPSVSSNTSQDGGRQRVLQRRPSVGSMTERTFRSPSPGRSPVPDTSPVPPVPTVPVPEYGSMALRIQPFQTASQKLLSSQQGSWFAAAKSQDMAKAEPSSPRYHNHESEEQHRPGSISPSINFSYPRTRVALEVENAPSDLVYDSNSRRMIPRAELLAMGDSISSTRKPIKKRTRKHDAIRGDSHVENDDITTTTSPRGNFQTDFTSRPLAPIENSDGVTTSISQNDKEETPVDDIKLSPMLSTSPLAEEPSLKLGEKHRGSQTDRSGISLVSSKDIDDHVVAGPKGGPKGPSDTANYVESQTEGATRPVQTTFPVSDAVIIKHEPPPRSLSPKKSAMKVPSTMRGISPVPSTNGSETSSFGVNPIAREDVGMNRKRSVRVSWDDRNTVVVGETAERYEPDTATVPTMGNSHTKRPWHGLSERAMKKDTFSFDENETMSPRPALPLFGSVREKKAKEPEERPLVRLREREPSPDTSNLHPQATNAVYENSAAQSNNPAPEIVPAPEQSPRNAANISKFREPLPPLTAHDVSNAESDDASTSEVDIAVQKHLNASSSPAEMANESSITINSPRLPNVSLENPGVLPEINIFHPSPQLWKEKQPDCKLRNKVVPGSFPSDDETVQTLESSEKQDMSPNFISTKSVESSMVDPSQIIGRVSEDEDEDGSDKDSIYSDAYEDLSQVNIDGFLSLDAMLSPPAPMLQSRSISASSDRNPSNFTENFPETHLQNSLESLDDWAKAKAYWRSLTSDKRRQLEREALEDGHGVTEMRNILGSAAHDEGEGQSIYEEQYQKRVKSGRDVQATIDTSQQVDPVLTLKTHNADTKAVRSANRPTMPSSSKTMSQGQVTGSTQSIRSGIPTVKTRQVRDESNMSATKRENPQHSFRPLSPENMKVGATGTALSAISPTPSSRYVDITKDTNRKHHQLGTEYSAEVAAPINGKSILRRRGSDTSESSFTRKKPAGSHRNGMRQSMRGSMREVSSLDGERASSLFSLRSMSPAGSAFRRNSISSIPSPRGLMHNNIRQTLRHHQSNTGTQTRLSTIGRPNFRGKRSKSSSRFLESSDEEGDSTVFESRFDDSSDDDLELPSFEGKHLVKHLPDMSMESGMRTMHRQVPDGPVDIVQSVVLHKNRAFESPQDIPPALNLSRSRSGRGSLEPRRRSSADKLGRPSSAPRRLSFLSILRRKKDSDAKIHRNISESAARRDTRLERSTGQLSKLRSGSLRTRSSWPLSGGGDPNNLKEASQDMVIWRSWPTTTTDNQANINAFQSVLSDSQGHEIGGNQKQQNQIEPPKKKKFKGLRKIFKLYD